MMMAFWMTVGLFCLATQAAAQEPKPCLSPSRYMGSMTERVAGFLYFSYDYDYDAIEQRIHVKYLRDNSVREDLYLYQQGVHYRWEGDSCSKESIGPYFQPMGVPKNATFLSQVVLGTSSKAGHGLVVNNWRDDTKGNQLSFTDSDCLPVSQYMESESGCIDISTSFFNNLLVYRPDAFVIPDICKHTNLKTLKTETGNFLSFFQKQR